MSTESQVVPLDRSVVLAASKVLARAFQHDPLQVWILPDEGLRSTVSPAMFSTLILYSQLSGHVWTTQCVDGVSAWLSPGYVHTDDVSAQSGFNRLPEQIGAQASGRYTRFIDHLEMIRCRAMPEHHWYGVVIAWIRASKARESADRFSSPC
jgi:hypothetical protein